MVQSDPGIPNRSENYLQNLNLINQLKTENLSDDDLAELMTAFLEKIGKRNFSEGDALNQLLSGNMVNGNENTNDVSYFCNIILTNETLLEKIIDLFASFPDDVRDSFIQNFFNKKREERDDLN